jgi:predicted transcriptional regulator|tara:strand:+ start:663 stop:854 length:192 start_codon:yes stop_codon:yes gene_type:complete
MSRIAKEDVQAISHINYVSNSIHDFGDDIYEDLMERDHEEAKKKAQNLIKILADLIQSLTDEI